ncbi:MAG: hypothetical protein NSGCLCUN01_03761 [uncultured Clostridium sp.]
MKRFEKFNITLNTNESAEEQAIGMILNHVEETYGIEIDDIEPLKKRYYAQLEWLNQEVE